MSDEKLPPILVHVGYPRTATTALQTQLESTSGDVQYLGRFTRAGKDGSRWRYPELEVCMAAVKQADQRLSDLAIGTARRKAASSVRERRAPWLFARRRSASWLFASDERICKPPRNCTPDWRQRQAKLLKRVFPDCRILITIRRQDNLLVSLYKRELVRQESVQLKQTFSDWLAAGGGSVYACWQERFDFLSYYRAFSETFGQELVHVLPYELYTKNPSALLEIFSLCFKETTVDLNYKSRVNSDSVDSPIDREKLLTVTEKEMKEIAQCFRDQNSELARISGVPLADYGYV